jgi:predicted RNA binding protein YcfA (HicA-like mRNA interferase family)
MLKNSRDIIRRLEREGFVETWVRGSHHKFRHPDGRIVVVPHPKKDLPIGTVYEVYNQAKWPKD